MKFPVLWLASVSLSVWVGTEKGGTPRILDLVSRSRITLHFGAKAEKKKKKKKKETMRRAKTLCLMHVISHFKVLSARLRV